MRQFIAICRAVALIGVVGALPGVARAQGVQDLNPIQLQYGGGPLMDNVRVETLFWGRWWNGKDGNELRAYLNSFFQDLFTDQRYLNNLEQYGTNGYQIGNGSLDKTDTVTADLPGLVNDNDVVQLILEEVNAGRLPQPDANTLYVVFTPAQVVVQQGQQDSAHNFLGYHGFFTTVPPGPVANFVYAVCSYQDSYDAEPGNPHLMTSTASHELAEAVTDPLRTGWGTASGQEIGDIPKYLYEYGWLAPRGLWDVLDGASGNRYLVQKVWSNQDQAPVAFAPS